MKKTLALLIVLSNSLLALDSDDMDERLHDAVHVVNLYKAHHTIPQEILRSAKGIAVVEITKGAIGVSGSSGEGIVIAKTASGWSAPAAFSIGSVGVGLQIGVEISRMIFVLNTDTAIHRFSDQDKITLGGNVTAVAGPSNGGADSTVSNISDVYVYQDTDGAYAGVAVTGVIFSADHDTNSECYGKKITPKMILSGDVKAPKKTQELYQALGLKGKPSTSVAPKEPLS